MHYHLSFFIVLSFLFLLALGGIIFYYRYIKVKHTRERFAFVGLSTFAGFLIMSIGSLWIQNPMIDLANAILENMGIISPTSQTLNQGATLMVLFFCNGLLAMLILMLHRNWDGVKSERQAAIKEGTLHANIWKDISMGYKDIRGEINIKKHQAAIPKERLITVNLEEDTRPWQEKVKTLLNLKDQQYDIRATQWYEEYKIYITGYGEENNYIIIYCGEAVPTAVELRNIATFTSLQHKHYYKLLIVCPHFQKGTPKDDLYGFITDYYSEADLLDKLISTNTYKRYLEDFFERKQENSDRSLNAFYVPISASLMKLEKEKLEKHKPIPNIESEILNWAKNEHTLEGQHLAIMGEYGQGKTVLSHKIALEMIKDRESYQRIPIIINLRARAPRLEQPLDILGVWANRFGAKAEALWEWHRAGRLLLILEGFDEMDLVGDTEMLFDHFRQLWQLAKTPKAKILITGRQNLFANDSERRKALGIHSDPSLRPAVKAFYLEKMNKDQIKAALRAIPKKTSDEILATLAKSPADGSFVELLSRPSSLYQLSTVWDAELAAKKERLNSAMVIGAFIQKNYHRQESKNTTILTANERDYFMQGIALSIMLESGYTNQIKDEKLKHIINKLWAIFPATLAPYEDMTRAQANKQKNLKERLKTNLHAVDAIIKDVRSAGILVQDLSGRDLFRFAHKSYMEYLISAFYSSFLLQPTYDKNTLLKVNWIAKALNFTPNKMEYSPDITRFMAELISAKVERKDNYGKPIEAKKLEKLVFDSIFTSTLERIFPSLIGWINVHNALKYSMILSLMAMGLGFIYLWGFRHPILGLGAAGLQLLWIGIIAYYQFFNDEKIKITKSKYQYKAQLYQECLKIMQIKCKRFSTAYLYFVDVNLVEKPLAFRQFVLSIIAIILFVSGFLINFIAFEFEIAIAFAFAIAFAIAIAGAGAIAIAFAFAGAGAFAIVGAVAVAVAVAIAGAGAVAVAGAIAGAGAGAIAIAGAIAFAIAGAIAGALYSNLKKSWEALKEEVEI